MRRTLAILAIFAAALMAAPMGLAPVGALAQTSTATKDNSGQKPAARVAGGYGKWTMLCGKDEDQPESGERCSLVLPLIETKTQKLVFRVILTYGPKGRLVLRVDGPTGVALQRGLEMSTDAGDAYRIPFQTCLPMGCKALTVVEDDLRQDLVKSKQTTLVVHALNGRPIQTVADINGLALGLEALAKKRPAQAATQQ